MYVTFGLVGAAIFLAAGMAAAQLVGGDSAAVERAIPQSIAFRELFQKGGILMYPILGMSVVAVAFVVYFFVVIRPDNIAPMALRRDVVAKINSGNLDDARMACAYRPCPLAEITVMALDCAQATQKPDREALKEVIEGEGNRQSAALQGQTQYLLDVAVITPMLGLLGTVFGMMRAFNVVAFDLAKAKPMLLAAGVAEALITTAAGLIVGIPAMAFYAYFRNKASRMISNLEVASGEIVMAIVHKRSE